MNQSLKQATLFIIALVGLLLFTVGIIEAFRLANRATTDVEVLEFNKNYWSYIITSVNGLLTINLGVLLGVEIVVTARGQESFAGRFFKFENIQLITAILFLIILLITFLVWAVKFDFRENAQMPTVIPQIAKTFFALIVAVLGLVLAKKAT